MVRKISPVAFATFCQIDYATMTQSSACEARSGIKGSTDGRASHTDVADSWVGLIRTAKRVAEQKNLSIRQRSEISNFSENNARADELTRMASRPLLARNAGPTSRADVDSTSSGSGFPGTFALWGSVTFSTLHHQHIG